MFEKFTEAAIKVITIILTIIIYLQWIKFVKRIRFNLIFKVILIK